MIRQSLDSPFQERDSTIRADPHPQPSLLTHGLTGLSSLEVGHQEVAPPWGADQGQGWGLQPGCQEATSSPAAARVLEQVFGMAPCSHPTSGPQGMTGWARRTPEILSSDPLPHFCS